MATEQILAKLWETIESRRSDPTSYTGDFLQNPFKLRKKFNEEAYELLEAHQARLAGGFPNVIAGDEGRSDVGFGTRRHVTAEAADLLFHLYVVLASADVTPSEVYAVLERRHAMWTDRVVAD
jgi:phosphoribosyl-ATP pyrophosphohydrolase